MKDKFRIAILARVSSEEQARGQSIAGQVSECTEFAESNGWQIAEVIHEPGDSGKRVLYTRGKFKPRPGITRLLELVENRKIDGVIASVQDRFHRNDFEFEILLRQHLWPSDIQVWTTDGQLTDDTVQGWRSRKAASLEAEAHSRNTSEKLRKANKRRRAEGKLVSGRPFGTMRGPDGSGRICNPDTFPVLKDIFERAARQEPHLRISRDLEKRGIPTVDGGRWHQATVRSIVMCRWYIGEIVHKGQTVSTTEHDCMVPRELWDSAQPTGTRGRKPSNYIYILQGLVVSNHWVIEQPIRLAGEPVRYNGRKSHGKPVYIRHDQKQSPYYLVNPVDDGHTQMPATFRAPELENRIMEYLVKVTHSAEPLLRAKAEADRIIHQALDEVERLSKEHSVAARHYAKLEKKLLRALDTDASEAIRILNDQVISARVNSERIETALKQAQSCAAAPIQEVPEAQEQLYALETLWKDGDRFKIQQLLRKIIRSINIRTDGIGLDLLPLLKLDGINIRTGRGSLRPRG